MTYDLIYKGALHDGWTCRWMTLLIWWDGKKICPWARAPNDYNSWIVNLEILKNNLVFSGYKLPLMLHPHSHWTLTTILSLNFVQAPAHQISPRDTKHHGFQACQFVATTILLHDTMEFYACWRSFCVHKLSSCTILQNYHFAKCCNKTSCVTRCTRTIVLHITNIITTSQHFHYLCATFFWTCHFCWHSRRLPKGYEHVVLGK